MIFKTWRAESGGWNRGHSEYFWLKKNAIKWALEHPNLFVQIVNERTKSSTKIYWPSEDELKLDDQHLPKPRLQYASQYSLKS